MSVENNPAEVSYPEDFAAFEALMNTGKAPEAETKEVPAADDVESSAKTEPESEPEDDQESEDESKPEEEKQPKKGGFQRRIDKLTREKGELAARLEAIEQKLAGKPAEAAVDAKPAAKLDPDTFESYEAYLEALADQKVEERIAKKQAEEQKATEQRKQVETQQTVAAKWQERVTSFAAKHADFSEVLEAVEVPISNALQQVILESEKGPQLAYELAKNPKEIERLNALSPLAVAREIGRLEAKYEKTPEPTKQPKVTSAPEPIRPVSHSAKGRPARIDDPDLDFSAFEKLANEKFR